ncbi:MAG: penicillin-binding protein 2 [Chthonomonadaceae bacterium]|nr:penicillin-binding protein 2 [Chthonomonadaceae bacterium]
MAGRGTVPGETVKHRVRYSFGMIASLYGLLVLRMLYVQGVQGDRLKAEAEDNRKHTVTLAAHRGSILDRNLRPLAQSRYTGAVGFDPLTLVTESGDPRKAAMFEKRLKRTAEVGARLLSSTPEEMRRVLLTERDHYRTELAIRQATHPGETQTPTLTRADRKGLNRFVILRENVSLEVAQRVRAAGLMSIGVQDDTTRSYPNGRDVAQIVGLNPGGGDKSLNGLERSQAKWLDGIPGKAVSEMDKTGRPLPDTRHVLKQAREGYDVVTTLDADIQHLVCQEAAEVYRKYSPAGVSIIVVEPQTGDILAMSGMPDYDPETFLNDPVYRNESVKSGVLNASCLTHLFEPGSTMKAITIAAALDQKVISPERYFNCPGVITVDKRALRCDKHGGTGVHGSLNFEGILRQSCNIGSAKIGMEMGATRLYKGFENFGLFDKLDVQMPMFPRGRKIMFRPSDPREIMRQGRIARVAFGHSIGVTPLHVAMAYAALANGGKLMQPRLVAAVRDMDGKLLKTNAPKMLRQAVSAETAAIVERGLRAVVTSGTGKIAAVPGYTIAGKTGTAKLYKSNEFVGSFAGFLPASPDVKPRVVIYVMVDRPKGSYYGSDVAAPAFQHIAAQLARHLHMAEDDPQSVQYKTAIEKRKLQARGLAH